MPEPRPRRFRLALIALAVYALLLAASHIWTATRPVEPLRASDDRLLLPLMTADGPVAGETIRLKSHEWGSSVPSKPLVVLLHGSPGDGGGFGLLAPKIAREGYRVVAPDLPGFGDSDRDLPDLSARSHARTVLALLDELHADRAHIVGWSNGGAVALHLADLAPRRTASITLLASIGDQRAEGSGSYYFEHAKYKLGLAAHAVARWLLPHFGALTPGDIAWLRNFEDSDQRPLTDIMRSTRVPALILHGRHDFLTPAWGAELHHRLMASSHLVMLDASHFIPFMQADEAAPYLLEHFKRHDDPYAVVRTDVVDLAPALPPTALELALRDSPWWLLVFAIAILCARWPELTAGLVTAGIAGLWIDFGVGVAGLSLGMLLLHGARTRPPPSQAAVWFRRAHRRPMRTAIALRFMPWERREGLAASRRVVSPSIGWLAGSMLGTGLWLAVTMTAAGIGVAIAGASFGASTTSARAIVVLLFAVMASVTGVHLVTRLGRQHLLARLAGLWTHEFWPSWAYYGLLSPWLVLLAIRHRGVMTWSCANPGVPMGGGIIGESKALILQTLEQVGDETLAARLIEPGCTPSARAEMVERLVASEPTLGGWPVILKPDSGFKGFAVRRAQDRQAALRYCREMSRSMIVQRYHPGPCEYGVLWYRKPDGNGAIFGITTKTLPTMIADGVHTREQLILRNPRLRLQRGVFLSRLGVDRDAVDPAGSTVALGIAGNHAQGCRFGDGSHLATPELEQTLTRLANAFENYGMDFGRFDVRCSSEEDLRTGRGLGIVELNGTTSEATHLYTPGKPLAWRLGIMGRQWRVLYEIGARRRSTGWRPVSLLAIAAGLVSHYRGRPRESSIS